MTSYWCSECMRTYQGGSKRVFNSWRDPLKGTGLCDKCLEKARNEAVAKVQIEQTREKEETKRQRMKSVLEARKIDKEIHLKFFQVQERKMEMVFQLISVGKLDASCINSFKLETHPLELSGSEILSIDDDGNRSTTDSASERPK